MRLNGLRLTGMTHQLTLTTIELSEIETNIRARIEFVESCEPGTRHPRELQNLRRVYRKIDAAACDCAIHHGIAHRLCEAHRPDAVTFQPFRPIRAGETRAEYTALRETYNELRAADGYR